MSRHITSVGREGIEPPQPEAADLQSQPSPRRWTSRFPNDFECHRSHTRRVHQCVSCPFCSAGSRRLTFLLHRSVTSGSDLVTSSAALENLPRWRARAVACPEGSAAATRTGRIPSRQLRLTVLPTRDVRLMSGSLSRDRTCVLNSGHCHAAWRGRPFGADLNIRQASAGAGVLHWKITDCLGAFVAGLSCQSSLKTPNSICPSPRNSRKSLDSSAERYRENLLPASRDPR